jgi:hypothetical protein
VLVASSIDRGMTIQLYVSSTPMWWQQSPRYELTWSYHISRALPVYLKDGVALSGKLITGSSLLHRLAEVDLAY